jgi:hypothetical protein
MNDSLGKTAQGPERTNVAESLDNLSLQELVV